MRISDWSSDVCSSDLLSTSSWWALGVGLFCWLIVMHLRAVGPVLDRLDVGEVAGEHCPAEDAERTQAHAERDPDLNQRQGFHLLLPTSPPWLRAPSRRRGAPPRLPPRPLRPAASPPH